MDGSLVGWWWWLVDWMDGCFSGRVVGWMVVVVDGWLD